MGLDDRDYMRDRYRKRRGLSSENTRWNNKKDRVELDAEQQEGTARGGPWFAPKNQGFDYQKNRWRPKGRRETQDAGHTGSGDDSVPLGSASWIGSDPGKEFEMKNPGYAKATKGYKPKASSTPRSKPKKRGLHIQKNVWWSKRGRRRAARARMAWAGKLILPLILLTYGVRMYSDAKRWDFLPDLGLSEPFPESGEFKVRRGYASGPTAPFTVISGDRKVVVQLLDHRSEPIFATYVRENASASVQAPRGKWIVRLIEGHAWHGDGEFFGANTVTEDAIEKMDFTEAGHTIDLRRRVDGNMHTVNRWTNPTF